LTKKQKKIDIKHIPTSRQLSKWERQKKLQRYIMITGLVFIIIILSFIGYGYYDSAVRPLQKPVLSVNDTTYNMDYYLKLLGLYVGNSNFTEALQTSHIMTNKMINDAIVIQKSSELGVTISKEDINEQIKNLNIPDDTSYKMMIEADMLTQKLINDVFTGKIPASVDQADVKAIFIDSKESGKEILTKLATSDNFTAVSEHFNVDGISFSKSGNLGWIPKGYTELLLRYPKESKFEETVFSLPKGELSQPIYDPSITKTSGYWIIKVMEKDEDISRRTSGILLGTYEEAMEVKKRLEAGEDFISLVKQLSQDQHTKDLDGDLGWLHNNYGDNAMNDAAFNLDIGQISYPIREVTIETKGGYWIIKINDRADNKELDSSVKNIILQSEFQNWIDEQKALSTIKEHLTEAEKIQLIDTILKVKK
jgi:parvulin-like peptidyl-prolyl isomerase